MDTVESIKGQLGALLGSNGLPYWQTLSEFVAGKTSRIEFEREMRRWMTTPELGKSCPDHSFVGWQSDETCIFLVKLHNSLLMEMITVSRFDSEKDATPTTAGPIRKRRRMLPHQDPPPRLRKWAAGLRKAERERVRGIGMPVGAPITSQVDEVRLERPISLRQEGKRKSIFFQHLLTANAH